MVPSPRPKRPVLLVSAMDSSGAAGMAVDIRVAQAHRHPVRCAVTALTVQDDLGVRNVFPAPVDSLVEAIAAAIFQPPGTGSVKIGAVGSARTATALSKSIRAAARAGIPVVLDPVLGATSGEGFLDPVQYLDWVRSVASGCTIVTPNRKELYALSSNLAPSSREDDRAMAILDLGAKAVLVTGGAGESSQCVDRLYLVDQPVVAFKHSRIRGGNVRGTGCALSTAIACRLARGEKLRTAVGEAIAWLHARISKARTVGKQRLLFS